MKVYSCPTEVAWAKPDYANYDSAKEMVREKEHEAALAQWLRDNGADGPRTGETLSEHVADGYARYMYADAKPAYLIHLPYLDAYHSRNVEFLPKKEVLARLDRQKAMDRLTA